MLISAGKPFFSSQHMSDVHLMIIYYVGQVEGRNTIGANDNEVLDGLKLYLSKDFVFEILGPLYYIGFDSHCIWLFIFDLSFYFLKG